MNTKQNLHTHSQFDDGKNTVEEMILSAIQRGFGSIGFSGHSYTSYAPGSCLNPETEAAYKKEVLAMREKYKDKIKVYLGLEFDMYSGFEPVGFDYVIGSVHYLKCDGEIVAIDRTAEIVKNVINNCFGGDAMAYSKCYFDSIARLSEFGKFDIIGHFDVHVKNNELMPFVDEANPKYLEMGFGAIESLRGKIPYFEVNTGAISRGYKQRPYPSFPFLERFKELGFGAVISSDCHKAEAIDASFDYARDLLIKAGFKERYILTDDGFKAVEI